jgi:hypothetical protein
MRSELAAARHQVGGAGVALGICNQLTRFVGFALTRKALIIDVQVEAQSSLFSVSPRQEQGLYSEYTAICSDATV